MTQAPEGFLAECQMRIEASRETVFGFFVDAEQMVRWQGISAELDPRPGGVFRVEVTPGWNAVGEFRHVDPPVSLSFTWGWDGEGSPVPPGSSLVEVWLDEEGDATIVRLRHSGLPSEEMRSAHAEGHQHYLERLAVVAAGGDPGEDPWLRRE